jgi:hypothetical protein
MSYVIRLSPTQPMPGVSTPMLIKMIKKAPSAAALAAALALLIPVTHAVAGTGGTGGTACHHVTGPFRTHRGYMVTALGHRFTPYGISVTGIKADTTAASVEATEDAAASIWCANLVRVGVGQHLIIGSQGAVNNAYLTLVKTIISHAEADHLAVALVMSRGKPGVPREYMPTWKTKLAWRAVYRQFGSDPDVIFELWNEPRHTQWARWRNGGYFGSIRFYGMERVARWLRGMGYKNLIWVDGIHSAAYLNGVGTYHLRHVGPVAYSVHHPPAPYTPTSWTKTFGYLVGRYAVVDGEWTNYSRSHAVWACWDNAPVSVPRFLQYMATHHIGIVAFSLTPGKLLASPSFSDPTYIRKDWACVDGLNEGAGHRILGWFRQHNGWAFT